MTEPVTTGQIVAGKYRVDRVIGQGAMGLVVAATHLTLGRHVALKFMIGGGPGGREREERFLREARAASMLQSQHVGKVLDVATLEGGAPYIVMELLDGKDLAAVLRERSRLPIAEAVTYVLQACEAVAEAHGAGIIHRDIKPANLFLTRGPGGSPCVKVVDFGIAKLGGEASSSELTGTMQALGSPLYMSPEQMASTKTVDFRGDIWSLGVVLYELLAAATPFAAPSVPAVCARVFRDPPTPLAEHRPDVPPGLAAIITRCLEKDPGRRWPTVATLAAALAPYASATAPAPAPIPASAPVPAPALAPASAPSAARAPFPVPGPAPVPAPSAAHAPVPIPGPAPVPAPSAARAPFPVPGPGPVPAPSAARAPVPAPAPYPARVPAPVMAPPATVQLAAVPPPSHPATLAATVVGLPPSPPPQAPPAPRPRSRIPAITAAALALGLPLAVFLGLRGRDSGSKAATVPTLAPTASEAAPSPPVPSAPAPPPVETSSAAAPGPSPSLAAPSPSLTAAPSPPVTTVSASGPRAKPLVTRAPSAVKPAQSPWGGSRQ